MTFVVCSLKKTLKKKNTFWASMTWSDEVASSQQGLPATRPNRSWFLSQTRMLQSGNWKLNVSCHSCCLTRKDLKKQSV